MKIDEPKENLNRLGLFPKAKKKEIVEKPTIIPEEILIKTPQLQIAEVEKAPMLKMSDYAFEEVKEYFGVCKQVMNKEETEEALKRFARGRRAAKMIKAVWLAWKDFFNGEVFTELQIVEKLLKEKELIMNAANNTLCINEVFSAMYDGYIVPTENLHKYKLGEFE